MAPSPREEIEFTHDDWTGVVERAGAMAGSGKGWINLHPEVIDVDGLAEDGGGPRVGLGAMFWTRGPAVPMATWVMATSKAASTIGIEHGVRAKVLRRLRDQGIEPPPGAVMVQDNARRGLVLRLPDGAEPEVVLGWLMEAVDELCPLQLTGAWLAQLHPG